jgi:glycosyltransferase involved in cell wall biosynthesis
VKRIAVMMPANIRILPAAMYVPALHALIRSLAERCSVTVYCAVPASGHSTPFSCGSAEVQFIPARSDAPFAHKLWHYTRRVLQDHRREAYDIVHGFWALPCGLAAVMCGRFVGIPAVVSLMGAETAAIPGMNYGNMRRWDLRSLTRATVNAADHVTCLSETQHHQMQICGMSPRRVAVIPLGVDPGQFPFVRKELSPPYRFLAVGHINRIKDYPTMLRTFRAIVQHHDAVLRIVGADHLSGEMQRLAQSLGVAEKTHIVGILPYDELPSEYRRAQFLLHTSLHESGPVVMAEAAASGTVVCGTRVGIIADLENICTVAADPCDHQGLAEKVLGILASPERYRALAQASWEWAASHSIEWSAQNFVSVYDAASGQRGEQHMSLAYSSHERSGGGFEP